MLEQLESKQRVVVLQSLDKLFGKNVSKMSIDAQNRMHDFVKELIRIFDMSSSLAGKSSYHRLCASVDTLHNNLDNVADALGDAVSAIDSAREKAETIANDVADLS